MNAIRMLFPSLAVLLTVAGCDERATEPQAENVEFSPAASTAGIGSWTSRAPMPTPRAGLATAVVRNAFGHYILYAIGGCCGTSQTAGALRRVEAYNATTNAWSRKANMPAERSDLNGAEVIGGKIYVPGGLDESGTATKTLYVYDPATDTWGQKANLPRSIAAGITAAIGGKLFLLTGKYNALPQRLYRYDPRTDTWTRRADAPGDHRYGSGTVINGKLYLVWGHSPTVDVYDPTTNTWTRRLTMSQADWPQYTVTKYNGLVVGPAIFDPSAVNLGNRLHLIGGTFTDSEEDTRVIAESYAYDPVTNRWTRMASLARTRTQMGAGKVKNGAGRLQILVTGGESGFEAEEIVRTTEAFSP